MNQLPHPFAELTQRALKARLALLGPHAAYWQDVVAQAGDAAPYLEYTLATLPLSDLGDYCAGLFLSGVRQALWARKSFHWCAGLPVHMFLHYVLCPRVNNEELSDCRGIFAQALAPRVEGLSLSEAILEVNRWCAENVTYRPTDDRTSSPLSVYRRGWGRCGEESVFTVTALRSVGICARQVYAPWWSHCDDNHAWVEAWDGEGWRYLGACEPEPQLDRGWFTPAAGRAMLVHTRSFVGDLQDRVSLSALFPGVSHLDLTASGGVAVENLTARYAPTVLVTAAVQDGEGVPVAGAPVEFSVLNMGAFRPVARCTTDRAGRASLRLGLGSVLVSASDPNSASGGIHYTDTLIDTRACTGVTLTLGAGTFLGGFSTAAEVRPSGPVPPAVFCADSALCSFYAPEPPAVLPAALSGQQKAARQAVLDEAAGLRQRKAALFQESTEKAKGQESFLARRVQGLLPEKDDSEPLPSEVVADCARSLPWEGHFPGEVFDQALLCPRIGQEPLRPLPSLVFEEGQASVFARNPQALWQWVESHILAVEGYAALPQAPAGALHLKAAGEQGRRTLFCALCRGLGVPARLSPLDGLPEFWQQGAYAGVRARTAWLSLTLGSRGAYSLARREEAQWRILNVDLLSQNGQGAVVEPGNYRLLAVTRLPSGQQLLTGKDFTLKAGDSLSLSLAAPAPRQDQLLQALPLPPVSLWEQGRRYDLAALFPDSPAALFCWLEPGREPTEHLLHELADVAPTLEKAGCGVALVFSGQKSPALSRAQAALPGVRLCQGDPADVPGLARCLYVDPERLPLVLLTDAGRTGLYACSGYNVGLGNLLVGLLLAL